MSAAFSIHIGVENYHSDFYNIKISRLGGCHNDMQAMAAIAHRVGFPPSCIRQLPDATLGEVQYAFRDAINHLAGGGLLFFTFSGHGMSNPTTVDGCEADLRDESICLKDSILLDNELYYAWTQFAAGVRIVCLFDSCHSGSAMKMNRSEPHRAERYLPKLTRLATGARARSLSDFEKGMVLAAQGDQLANRTRLTCDSIGNKLPKAVGVSLSACSDGNLAYESRKNGALVGHFTHAVRQAFDAFNGQLTLVGLHKHVRDTLAVENQPQVPCLMELPSQFYGIQGQFYATQRFLSF